MTKKWLACTNHVIKNRFDDFFKKGGPGIKSTKKDENSTLDSMDRDAREHGV